MQRRSPAPAAGRKARASISTIGGFVAAILALTSAACGKTPTPPAASGAKPSTSATTARPRITATDATRLLAAARTAYAAHRVVAPPGDNAVEYYEQVLALEPGNRIARDALRELFPFAARDVQRTIAHGRFDEAAREISLLAKSDPSNYTLTLLRSSLDARRGGPVSRQLPGHGAAGVEAARAAAASPDAPLHAGAHVIVVHASGDSWLRVTTVGGAALDERVVHAGESRTYRTDGPVQITVGDAAHVAVAADGRPVPLGASRPNEVAHLTLFAVPGTRAPARTADRR